MDLQKRVLSRRVKNLVDFTRAASSLISSGGSATECIDAIAEVGREASGIHQSLIKIAREEQETLTIVTDSVPHENEVVTTNG
jgi:hypothetical protein